MLHGAIGALIYFHTFCKNCFLNVNVFDCLALAQMKNELAYHVCCEWDEYPRSYAHLFTQKDQISVAATG